MFGACSDDWPVRWPTTVPGLRLAHCGFDPRGWSIPEVVKNRLHCLHAQDAVSSVGLEMLLFST